MEFKDAMKCVADVLSATGTEIKSNYYDGIVVKKLEASNTLDEGRTTNQTHIAFTGLQMDIFPYLKADGYFDAETGDQTLKKYFVERIPVCLQETNIEYLGTQDANLNINFTNGKCEGVTSVIRSKRENQADQIQVSLKQYDSPEFIDFRKMLHVGTYLIILKKEKQFFYDVFGVLAGDGGQLNDLNNKFFKKTTSTIIDVAKFKYEIEDETKDNGNNEHKGANILLYGIPGSGKSFRANKLAHTKEHPERVTHVVFHPEYSYQDFMGQIMPELKEVEVDGAGDTDTPIHKKALSYSFIPGPFTIALSKAYADPNNPYYLIIDEINRGNAPAIFGEAFQLLDRNRRTKASEYGVDNHEVAEKIYADLNLEQKNRLGDKVFIPGNLTIIATMNTGDQNVFRLDTAFSRRWSKELVRNQFESAEEDTEEEKEYLCNLSNTILLKEEPNVSTLNPHNIT